MHHIPCFIRQIILIRNGSKPGVFLTYTSTTKTIFYVTLRYRHFNSCVVVSQLLPHVLGKRRNRILRSRINIEVRSRQAHRIPSYDRPQINDMSSDAVFPHDLDRFSGTNAHSDYVYVESEPPVLSGALYDIT
jgi:hypothetical protein